LFIIQNKVLEKESEHLIYYRQLNFVKENKAVINLLKLCNPNLNSERISEILGKNLNNLREELCSVNRKINSEKKREYDLNFKMEVSNC
jgi:hypothetical protein